MDQFYPIEEVAEAALVRYQDRGALLLTRLHRDLNEYKETLETEFQM